MTAAAPASAEAPSPPEEPAVPEVAAAADEAAAPAPEADEVEEVEGAAEQAEEAVEAAEAPILSPAPGVPATPKAPVSAPAPSPSDPASASPHLDEEPSTLVAEVADPGAEDGVGAELHVDEPWPGYARMKVREISDHLSAESGEALLAVRLYEVTHKNRRGALEAVERELKRR